MSDSSAHSKSCPRCGAALSSETTEGLCPSCLMAEAMQPTIVSDASKPKHSVVLAPEELAPFFPQYEILRMLGRGGMGAVYLARQISLNRLVAIKILPTDMGESDLGFAERFKNEAQAMARLSHPGIVAVYDFGQTSNGLLYIVMEYIEGTDVQLMLTSQGRLHSAHAMAITAHVCDALQYAHSCGIIHRDIKPSNIMVGNNGVVKVADFGLAKMSHGQTTGLTQSGMAMGTLHFMAPEALTLGSAVDQRADIYAVGVMLYQMLTGKLPQGMFEMPSFQVAGLDPRYDRIVAKALRDDREVRYQAAADLRHDLDAILTQPVEKSAPDAETEVKALPPVEARGKKKARVPSLASPHAAPEAPRKKKPVLLLLTVLGLSAVLAAAIVYFRGHGSGPTTTQPALATKEKPFVNSLGMKFVPVPITGGPTDGKRVLFSIWETRVQDYEMFVKETKREWPNVDFLQGPTHPAVTVNREDARTFCQWLTEHERKSGRLGAAEHYRLPSDHEWSCAVAIGDREDPTKLPEEKDLKLKNVFPWGSTWPPPIGVGNYPGEEGMPKTAGDATKRVLVGYRDGYIKTAPVGSFPPNSLGLYDLSGNAWEWCEDWHDSQHKDGMLRGASWLTANHGDLNSSKRYHGPVVARGVDNGFRCVLDSSTQAISSPSTADQVSTATATQAAPFTNTLGMKFVPVPGTEVLFCIHETRYKDYAEYAREVKGVDDSWLRWKSEKGYTANEQLDNHPVTAVSWENAKAFCDWLSKKEGVTYRLPTDREWSLAVGVGHLEKWDADTTPATVFKSHEDYPWGSQWPLPKGAGNYSDQSRKRLAPTGNEADYIEGYDDGFPLTAPVMSFQPNKLGLYDLGGNVAEWCEDWFDATKKQHVVRGAAWYNHGEGATGGVLFSSARHVMHPGFLQNGASGFRVIVVPTAAKVAEASNAPFTTPLAPAAHSNKTLGDDRKAAEWVLSVGGTLVIEERGRERRPTKHEDLPPGNFVIKSISLKPRDNDEARRIESLRPIAGLQQLVMLEIARVPLQDDDYLLIPSLPALRILALTGTHIRDENIPPIVQQRRLTQIVFNMQEGLTTAAIASLRTMPAVNSLTIFECPWVTAETIQLIAEWPNLIGLDLGDTNIGDPELKTLGRLPNLTALRVARNPKITPEGLRAFSGRDRIHYLAYTLPQKNAAATVETLVQLFPNLDTIDFAQKDAQVRDAELGALAKLPKLNRVNLSGRGFGNSTLEVLIKLPGLVNIDFANSSITQDAIQAAMKAHPNLKITAH